MSKTFRSFLFIFVAVVQILHLFNNSRAQGDYAYKYPPLLVIITINPDTPTILSVEGEIADAKNWKEKNFSFPASAADIHGVNGSISNVQLYGGNKAPVRFRRLMEGQYLAEDFFTSWSYKVDLHSVEYSANTSHRSWLSDTGGTIMLDDVLPQTPIDYPFFVIFKLPPKWQITTNVLSTGPLGFQTMNRRGAVFYLGVDQRDKLLQINRSQLRLNISGDWLFSDSDAMSVASSIFGEYSRVFSPHPTNEFVIGISKFQGRIAPDIWDADTRGQTITIVSSDTPFRSQSLQRLHEQLRHEMFHLWIPNGVNLTGNYDWFYEGFALYQSLKTGLELNRIRFDDYLDTLSRAYEIDRQQRSKLSLIELSRNRWSGDNNTVIYARGMLVAFLCDLALLEKSKGKRSVTDLLRKLYESHRPPNPETDGNTTVLALLRSYAELTPIIDRNITGAESIEWNELLKGAGLEVDTAEKTTNLKVTAKPSGRQKDLLDKLGYNNWRKLDSKR